MCALPQRVLLCLVIVLGTHAWAADASEEVKTLAAQLAANGNHAAAISALDEFLKDHPDETNLRLDLARYLGYAKRYPEASAQYAAVLVRQPGNLAAKVGTAKVASWQGEFERSLRIYDEVLARSPHLYDARVGRGFTLAWMGRNEEALTALQAALKTHPDDKEVLAEVARLTPLVRAASREVPRAPIKSKEHAVAPRKSAPAPIYPTTFAEPISPERVLPARPESRVPWLIALALAVLLAGGSVATFVWKRSAKKEALTVAPPPVAAVAPEEVPPSAPMRVLLLESNESAAAFLRSVFVQWNVESGRCEDVGAARQRLAEEEFEYAIIDFASVTRDDVSQLAEAANGTALIFACAEMAEVQIVRQMGCCSVLKPFSIAELYAVLHAGPTAARQVAASR